MTRTVKRDENAYARLGWLLVLFGFGGALLWAAFAPLDQGVAVPATVIISGQRKSVQHPLGGVVKHILVRDGQHVEAGEPLIRMEPTQARANVDSLLNRYANARLNQARLQAEYDGRRTLEMPAGLAEQAPLPTLGERLELQRPFLHSRQTALANELSALRANIEGLRAQLEGLRQTEGNQRLQQRLLNSQLSGARDLAEEGYMPRNQLLEQERQLAEVNARLSESSGRFGQIRQSIAEAQMRIAQREEEYRKEVNGQLAETQVNARTLWEELSSARYELRHAEIRAPVSGYVAGLKVFTDGGVIGPGELLMYIVPNSDSLEVEGQLAVNLVDRIHSGLPVEMLFTAFNQSKTPRVTGEVTMVSADRLLDEQNKQPYYALRAQVDAAAMGKLKGLQIRPGMAVQVFVRTGERRGDRVPHPTAQRRAAHGLPARRHQLLLGASGGCRSEPARSHVANAATSASVTSARSARAAFCSSNEASPALRRVPAALRLVWANPSCSLQSCLVRSAASQFSHRSRSSRAASWRASPSRASARRSCVSLSCRSSAALPPMRTARSSPIDHSLTSGAPVR